MFLGGEFYIAVITNAESSCRRQEIQRIIACSRPRHEFNGFAAYIVSLFHTPLRSLCQPTDRRTLAGVSGPSIYRTGPVQVSTIGGFSSCM